MYRKESRLFRISVEGENCEKMYFLHLAALINSSGRNTYNLKLSPVKMSPKEYAKRNAHLPVEKQKKNKALPYFHVQDIEDYYDDSQKDRFFGVIREMRQAEKEYGIRYALGYSNYTFELWLLLHVAEMNHAVADRGSYLGLVNKWFGRKFSNLNEFKRQDEFQGILNEFVTLDSVLRAIARAERIVEDNAKTGKQRETYKGFTFYRDNPDLTVHELVKLIFEVCEVK